MDIDNRRKRMKIHFSRTYRHFSANLKQQLIFTFVLVIPIIILSLLFYTDVSKFITDINYHIFKDVHPMDSIGIASSDFIPGFGNVYHISMPSAIPAATEIWINLVITIILLSILMFEIGDRKRRTPLPVYFSFILIIHLISILFFAFARDVFPYSATTFSELYMKQQIVLWFAFIVMVGFVLGVLGYGKMGIRILLFFTIITYAFIFGIVRFITFSFIITIGSSIYMAVLFFALGPLYDFLYFVFFYSIYVNREINYFGYGEGRYEWKWL